jgi:peptidoglycan/LPS O-acetylase OafA/YrhL
VRGRSGYAYLAGVAGAALGIAAGIAQWAIGNEIPEWTGDKLHPVQLGIITIALSLIALAAVVFAHRNPTISPRARVALAAAILLAAVICFTTVGRLWYLPGPLLIIAAGLLLAASPGAPRGATQ